MTRGGLVVRLLSARRPEACHFNSHGPGPKAGSLSLRQPVYDLCQNCFQHFDSLSGAGLDVAQVQCLLPLFHRPPRMALCARSSLLQIDLGLYPVGITFLRTTPCWCSVCNMRQTCDALAPVCSASSAMLRQRCNARHNIGSVICCILTLPSTYRRL